MRAIIIGAGIGGLTTALCLAHKGIASTILERADELGEFGAGIQIAPNGMHVLRALELGNAIAAKADAPPDAQFRDGKSGTLLGKVTLGQAMSRRFGAPYYTLHRADLITALADAVETRMPGSLRTAATVVGTGQDDISAWAILANGERVAGDVLIGADGIRSAVRDTLPLVAKPRFTGNMAWRAVVPVEKLQGLRLPLGVCAWLGPQRHAVTYPLRGGTMVNFVGVVERDDWHAESWTDKGSKAEALDDFKGWHRDIMALVEAAETHYRWALFDHPPLKQWCNGRIALLGDSAHPMLPYMAQGASQAMEDAWVVASKLAEIAGVKDALTSYFNNRQPRTARVQAAARANKQRFHQPMGLATSAALRAPAQVIATSAFSAGTEWLYRHDVTQ